MSGLGKVPMKWVFPRFGFPYTTIFKCCLTCVGLFAIFRAFFISSFEGTSVGLSNGMVPLLSHFVLRFQQVADVATLKLNQAELLVFTVPTEIGRASCRKECR